MNNKKVVFVINSLNSGGAERVLSTLANGLCHDYQVSIISFLKIKPFYHLDSKIEVLFCKNKQKSSRNFIEAIINNYALFRSTKNFCQVIKPDVLIGFMTNANVISTLVANLMGIPVLISERNNPNLEYTPTYWKLLRYFIYPKSSKLIVQTELIEEFYLKWIKKDHIKILPNPISKSISSKKLDSNNERQNIVLNVGRLSHQKGQEIAIRSFARLNPHNWEFHIVGEGPDREKLTTLIDDLNMTNKIKLLGRQDNISQYYMNSKIFVFPSRFEGFPNALIEAMYMELACISANCPSGPSELIENGENGFLFEVDNIDDLTKKLKIVIENNELQKNLGKNAFKTVLPLEENKVVEIWKKLIDQHAI